jgi:hypothetical protein
VVKHTIDFVPPAPPESAAPLDFGRLSDDQLRLLEYLLAKLEGELPNPQHAHRMQLTFTPEVWLKTQPGSDQLHPVQVLRFEAVPNHEAPLPEGQGVDDH